MEDGREKKTRTNRRWIAFHFRRWHFRLDISSSSESVVWYSLCIYAYVCIAANVIRYRSIFLLRQFRIFARFLVEADYDLKMETENINKIENGWKKKIKILKRAPNVWLAVRHLKWSDVAFVPKWEYEAKSKNSFLELRTQYGQHIICISLGKML